MTCSVADCENPARADVGSGLCYAHGWQMRMTGRVTTVIKRPGSALERLTEAALAYSEADEDEDFSRARDNLRKSALAYRAKYIAEAIRQALADMRVRGVKLGRPRKLDPAAVEQMVAQLGGVRPAAVALSVSVWTVRRALRLVRRDGPEGGAET